MIRVVIIESYSESRAVAFRIWEFVFFEIWKFKIHMNNFIKIDIIKIKNNNKLKDVCSGISIFSKEDFRKDAPTKITRNEMIKDEIYSYLPWPRGCSLSGGLIENLKPIMLITEEAESDKLLKESAVIETLFEIIPANNFIRNKMIFRNIPIYPHIKPHCERTFALLISL